MHIIFWSEYRKGTGHSEDHGIDGMILERVLGKMIERCGLD